MTSPKNPYFFFRTKFINKYKTPGDTLREVHWLRDEEQIIEVRQV